MRREHVTLRITILLLMAGLLHSPALYTQSNSFSGRWISSLGLVDLSVRGSMVTGTYKVGESQGTITGSLSGNRKILTGKWALDNTEGRFTLRLLDRGNAFFGRWWNPRIPTEDNWIGVRTNKELLQIKISTTDFQGPWQTNFGYLTIDLAGNKASGKYQGSKNLGSIRGEINETDNTFSGTWADQRYKGRVVFKLLKGRAGFLGEWWFGEYDYGGFWYGVRPVSVNGCLFGDCENGNGLYVWADGSRYEGNWQNKLYHGIGTRYNGYGEVESSGLWYKGVFQGTCVSGDCENGSGELTLVEGHTYNGDFQDCRMEGTGVLKYRNGDLYEGEFKDGVPNGTGTYTWAASSDKYVGSFTLGSIQGEGTYYFHSGDVFKGNFRKGTRHGKGEMSWADGDRYDGSWRDDTMKGRGVYTYKNGDQYSGQFWQGLKEGRGTYTFADGTSFSATWREDRPQHMETSDSLSSETTSVSAGTSSAFSRVLNNNQPLKPASVSGNQPKTAYFFYKIDETNLDSTAHQAVAIREVNLAYYVVYGKDDLSIAVARGFLEDQLKRPISGDFQVEKVSDPALQIKQLFNRYRFPSLQSQLQTSGNQYFYFSEN